MKLPNLGNFFLVKNCRIPYTKFIKVFFIHDKEDNDMLRFCFIVLIIVAIVKIRQSITAPPKFNSPYPETENDDRLDDWHVTLEESYSPENNSHHYSSNQSATNNTSYDDFEYKYYDKIIIDYDKYISYCYGLESSFTENFSIKYRIKKLETAIQKMDTIKSKYAGYGANGLRLYEETFRDCFEAWSKQDIIINTNGDNYCFEFENINLENYNFLTYLLNLYKTDTVAQTEHLKQEKLYHDIFDDGGTEAHEERIEYEKYIKSIRKKALTILKKEENILQSALVKMFDDDYEKNQVRKYISELSEKGKVLKEKKGSSYMITYLKPGESPMKNASQKSNTSKSANNPSKSPNISGKPIGEISPQWDIWDMACHSEADQIKRQISAQSAKCTPVFVDEIAAIGHFQGSSGNHTTSLKTCSCIDFNRRKKPCKHMYRLAMELNLMSGDIKSDIGALPSSSIKIEDAITTIETFSKEQKELLYTVLCAMKYQYHSEYAPVPKESDTILKPIIEAGILQLELNEPEFLLNTYRRNELNSRIADSNIDIKYNRNMKLVDLIEWCKSTLSKEQLLEVCSDKNIVSFTAPYLKSKHKMYLYLNRIHTIQSDLQIYNTFNLEYTQYQLPDDDVTALLKQFGYVK